MWRDVMREGDLGFHTSYVVKGLRDGFILFLVSHHALKHKVT